MVPASENLLKDSIMCIFFVLDLNYITIEYLSKVRFTLKCSLTFPVYERLVLGMEYYNN